MTEANMYNEHDIQWTDEKVARLWAFYARTPPYSEIYFSKVWGARVLKLLRLPLNASWRVLDFGCGPGYMIEHLRDAKSKWKYTGVDFSGESIETILDKNISDIEIESLKHITTLPIDISEKHFDICLLFEVVEHLNDDYFDQTMQEIARLLKLGGNLIITTPNNEDLSDLTRMCPDCGSVFHVWQHVRSWNAQLLAGTLSKYGLTVEKIIECNIEERTVFHKIIRVLKIISGRQTSNPHLLMSFKKTK
jgi:SAM-dependent methyltransferase